MFDSSFLCEGNSAYFHYINAKGSPSFHHVVNVVERDDLFQGYSVSKRAFRAFKKNRVVKMYSSEEEFSTAEINAEYSTVNFIPSQEELHKELTGLEICFTGFKADERSELTEIAKKNKLTVRTGVSANLYFLCVGKTAGKRKIDDAINKKALILDKDQFLAFIETGEIPCETSELDIKPEKTQKTEIEKLQSDLDNLSMTFKTLREPRRSAALMAVFVDGYASGWKFAVKESFKTHLDIRLTSITHEGKSYNTWTQGESYQFHRGDVFYSDRLAYTNWGMFLQQPHAVALQVKYECYSGYETIGVFEGHLSGEFNPGHLLVEAKKIDKAPIQMESQSYDPGTIIVEVLIPDISKTTLTSIKELRLTQDTFIQLLQSGYYWSVKKGEPPKFVDLLNNDRT